MQMGRKKQSKRNQQVDHRHIFQVLEKRLNFKTETRQVELVQVTLLVYNIDLNIKILRVADGTIHRLRVLLHFNSGLSQVLHKLTSAVSHHKLEH